MWLVSDIPTQHSGVPAHADGSLHASGTLPESFPRSLGQS